MNTHRLDVSDFEHTQPGVLTTGLSQKWMRP